MILTIMSHKKCLARQMAGLSYSGCCNLLFLLCQNGLGKDPPGSCEDLQSLEKKEEAEKEYQSSALCHFPQS